MNIEISTANITAIEDVDYHGVTNRHVSFAIGESIQSTTVYTAPTDLRVEGEERFEVCLSNPTEGVLGLYGLIRCAAVVIEDCDCK